MTWLKAWIYPAWVWIVSAVLVANSISFCSISFGLSDMAVLRWLSVSALHVRLNHDLWQKWYSSTCIFMPVCVK
jgi:hypothetical protein